MAKVNSKFKIEINTHENCENCNHLHLDDLYGAIFVIVLLIFAKSIISYIKKKN